MRIDMLYRGDDRFAEGFDVEMNPDDVMNSTDWDTDHRVHPFEPVDPFDEDVQDIAGAHSSQDDEIDTVEYYDAGHIHDDEVAAENGFRLAA